jgi:hypothetical protein
MFDKSLQNLKLDGTVSIPVKYLKIFKLTFFYVSCCFDEIRIKFDLQEKVVSLQAVIGVKQNGYNYRQHTAI